MSRDDVVAFLTVAAFAVPLLLALAVAVRSLRPYAIPLAPWAALPALVLAALEPRGVAIDWRWVVFGMHLSADGPLTAGFLLFTASLWLAAGLFARAYLADDAHRGRFWVFFLASASGNIGLVLADDVASFYVFFSLMTFAAYGLVVHDRSERARRAGRVYLVMSLGGEMLVLAALLLIVGTQMNLRLADVPQAAASSTWPQLVAALVLVGFGVKAGALFLHMWLPLAHPVAPTPASAVLSGAMIKAGLLGWLRFLPLGLVEMRALGAACVVMGMGAAFYGVAAGLPQRDPKTILAYSSISQMGFMTGALGIGLASPPAVPVVLTAILFYAMHHAFAKGALFLGTEVAKARAGGWPGLLVALGVVLPALEIAGAPLSSGALAKISLKSVVAFAPWHHDLLVHLLSLGAIGSSLLMIRFVARTLGGRRGAPASPRLGLWLPWALLLVFDLLFLLWPPVDIEELELLVHLDKIWSSAWPILVAGAVAAGAWLLSRRGARLRVQVPPGDVLHLLEVLGPPFRRALPATPGPRLRIFLDGWHVLLGPITRRMNMGVPERAEEVLAGFGTIGVVFTTLLAFFLALLLLVP